MGSSKQRQINCGYVSENKTGSGQKNHRLKSSVNMGAGLHLRCDYNQFHLVEMHYWTDKHFTWF
jgi:hypothetical protein